MKESLNLTESDSEKWQQLPRKFTRASIRFELPIDTREMARLKPFNYLSKYVYIDEDKKQLYHRTFVNFLPKLQPKEETENEGDDFRNLNEFYTIKKVSDCGRNTQSFNSYFKCSAPSLKNQTQIFNY